jgi:hypothetical protein
MPLARLLVFTPDGFLQQGERTNLMLRPTPLIIALGPFGDDFQNSIVPVFALSFDSGLL